MPAGVLRALPAGGLCTPLTTHLNRAVAGLDDERRHRAVLMMQLLVVQLDQDLSDRVVLGIDDVGLPELVDLLTEIWHASVRSW